MERKRKWDQPGVQEDDESPAKVPKTDDGKSATDAAAAAVSSSTVHDPLDEALLTQLNILRRLLPLRLPPSSQIQLVAAPLEASETRRIPMTPNSLKTLRSTTFAIDTCSQKDQRSNRCAYILKACSSSLNY